MIYAVTRAVNRVALGTGVDGEAAVTAGHHPECINDANWACATRRLGVWRQGATGAGRDQNEDFPISGDAWSHSKVARGEIDPTYVGL